MYKYTKNNYYVFSYFWDGYPGLVATNSVRYTKRPCLQNANNWHFYLDMTKFRCARKPKPLHIENCIAAEEIYDNRNGLPISVLMSGGIDSEIVATSFLKIKAPFTAYILQFKDNLNIHDISYAVSFCETNNVNYKLVELDIKKFLKEQAYDYASYSDTCCAELLSTMWLADQVSGLPIIGSGEPFFIKKKDHWFYREHERITGFYKHFIFQDRPAIPGFFQYSPELLASYSTTELIVSLAKNELDRRIQNSRPIKFDTLKRYYPQLYQRKKYTGFENIPELKVFRRKLELMFGDDSYDVEYEHFVKYLLGSGYDKV